MLVIIELEGQYLFVAEANDKFHIFNHPEYTVDAPEWGQINVYKEGRLIGRFQKRGNEWVIRP